MGNSSYVNKSTDSIAEFGNAPVVTWIHTDHERKCDFVNVAIVIFSGCKDLNFHLSEDGTTVSLNYSWPNAIFNGKELFSDELKYPNTNKSVTLSHPKIHSFTSGLIERGITENTIPRGSITVTLPMTVQREVGTWTKKAISKEDGTQIVLLQFRGYQQNIIINDADTSIHFD